MATQVRHEQYMQDLANIDNRFTDMVNSPPHYAQGNIETIDYIVDVLGEWEAVSYCHGNVLRYLSLIHISEPTRPY